MSDAQRTKNEHIRSNPPAPEGAEDAGPAGNGTGNTPRIQPDFRADGTPARQVGAVPAEQGAEPAPGGALTTAAAMPAPPSAFLVRRIAEAADGERGKPVYCTALMTPNAQLDYNVSTFDTLDDARAAQSKNPALEIFGPFVTAAAAGPESDSTPIVSIVVTLEGGSTINIDPHKYDSVFWTVSAVDKFLSPYYTASESLARAEYVKSLFDREGMACLLHGPTTEPQVKSVNDAEGTPIDALREGSTKSGLTFVTFR